MNTGDIIAGIGVGVALATSGGSLAVSLYVARRDRPHLRVSSSFALRSDDTRWHACITVANDGRYPEIVTNVGFKSSDGRQMFLTGIANYPDGRPPPRRLDAGEGMTAMLPALELHEQWAAAKLGRLTQVFGNTESGRRYSARPLAHFAQHAENGFYLKNGEKVQMD